MMKDYRDFGIVINSNSKGKWQRAKCPKCPPGRKAHDSDLAVNTDEEYWTCHRCGSTGNLKYGWSGESNSFVQVEQAKPPSKPDNRTGMYRYFESRKITKEIVDRNKILFARAYFPSEKKEMDCICFNYYIGDKLVNSKYRSSNKDFAQSKGGAKVFYKLNDIFETDEVIITEGEIDALSFEVAGFKNVISVPDGGIQPNWENIQGKLEFLKNSSEYIRHVKKFYLATDNDEVGIRLRDELAKRLGKEKCHIVEFKPDCKDPNDSLMKYGAASLKIAIEESKPFPIDGVQLADAFKDEVERIYDYGYPTGPYSGLHSFDKLLKYHEGTLLTITGIPSHGKTTFTVFLLNRYSTRQDYKYAIFSPEHSISSLMIILTRQIVKKHFHKTENHRMSKAEMEEAHNFIKDHFFFIDPLSAEKDTFTIEDLFEATKYLKMKYGINGLLIDSWTKIQHMASKFETETNYVQRVLNRMTAFTKSTGINIYLIAHPTKMEKKSNGEYKVPGLYDVAGSANFYNLSDIGITVHRERSETSDEDFTRIYISKMKEDWMGKTGSATLLHDKTSLSFFDADEEFDPTNDLSEWNEYMKIKEELQYVPEPEEVNNIGSEF